MIKETVLERVRGGAWRPGDLIPGELQLAEEFGCARATVHRALRELADEGVLERRRKTGTRVARPHVRSLALDIRLVDDEIRATGAVYDYLLLYRAEEPLPRAEAAALDRHPGETALNIRCLHYADRRPYQLEDRWIDLDTVPAARTADFTGMSPNRWLVDNVPWTEAEHTIYAESADASVAEGLSISPGEPILVVERRTWNEDGPVTLVRFHHPNTHRLRSTFGA
jgi:GntR family histidine utilization transcriptional repressor